MKLDIQSGLKLVGSVRVHDTRPTALQIKAKPVPCQFKLSTGASLLVCNPQGFAAIRDLSGVDHDSFFASLTRDELTGGSTQASGKSGSIFWFSKDGRFVLKTVAEEELQTLLAMLPKYARHLSEHRDSLLTRYLGAYRLTPCTGGDVRVVVMNNVLEGSRHSKVYDLKGTTEDRWVEEAEGRCLKDVNFEPITIHTSVETSARVHVALHADTQFLQRLHIMDYSLLLSIQFLSDDPHVDTHPGRYSSLMGGLTGTVRRGDAAANGPGEACIFRVGLIDMLTTYGFKKQIAHAVKSSTIGHFYDIDTEPPDVYADRFRCHLRRKIAAAAEEEESRPEVATAARPAAVRPAAAAQSDLLPLDAFLESQPPPRPAPASAGAPVPGRPPAPAAPSLESLLDLEAPAVAAARPSRLAASEHAAVGLDLLA